MKQEFKKAIGVFLSIAGLVGVVVQILSTPNNLRTIAFFFLSFLLLLLGAWIVIRNFWQKRKTAHALPDIKEVENICVTYRIDPATSDEIDWMAQLEAKVYPSSDAIPKHVLKEWYSVNPDGFFVIRMANGAKIGHLDILPLRPTTLSTFLEGNILERDIRGDSLYAPAEKHLIHDLYIESIIILPPKGYSNAPAILCLLSEFVSLVRKICDPFKVENVYAIAASKPGEHLMLRLGFDKIKSGLARTDQHDVFVAKFQSLAANISTFMGERLKEGFLPNQTMNRSNKKTKRVVT